jgi:hypothetical protein
MKTRIVLLRALAFLVAAGLMVSLSGRAQAQTAGQGVWTTGPGYNMFGGLTNGDALVVWPGTFYPSYPMGVWNGTCGYFSNGVFMGYGSYKVVPYSQTEGTCSFFFNGAPQAVGKVNQLDGTMSAGPAVYIRRSW